MEKDAEETLEQEKRGHKIVTAKILSKSESERKHKRKQAKILSKSESELAAAKRKHKRKQAKFLSKSESELAAAERKHKRKHTQKMVSTEIEHKHEVTATLEEKDNDLNVIPSIHIIAHQSSITHNFVVRPLFR